MNHDLFSTLEKLCFAFVFACLVALPFSVTGCYTSGKYQGTRQEVAENNAKSTPGLAGIANTPPIIQQTNADNASLWAWLGALAILAGGPLMAHKDLPNWLGLGLNLSGLTLILLSYVIPNYGGYFALIGGAIIGAIMIGGMVSVVCPALQKIPFIGKLFAWLDGRMKNPTTKEIS